MGSGTPGDPDFRAKIGWVPLDRLVAKTSALDVRVEHLADPPVGAPVRLRLGGDGNHSWTGAGEHFWPSTVPFPAAGRWRLTATAPGHWGCFELTV